MSKRSAGRPRAAESGEVAESLTIRVTPSDRARAEALRGDGESLGDVVRAAINLLADLAPLAKRKGMTPVELARALARGVDGDEGALAELGRDVLALVRERFAERRGR